jgi:hypothetical protein
MPNRAGKSYPKATSMASYGRSSLPFARRQTLKTLKTRKQKAPQGQVNGCTKATSIASLPPFSFTTPSFTENWLPQTVRWFICPVFVFTFLATFPLQAGQAVKPVNDQ